MLQRKERGRRRGITRKGTLREVRTKEPATPTENPGILSKTIPRRTRCNEDSTILQKRRLNSKKRKY
jgi:hypothetical protein